MNIVVRFVPIAILGAVVLNFSSARADNELDRREDRKELFNIQCEFKDKKHRDGQTCNVFSQFVKRVSDEGGEVTDDSWGECNPQFEIECDDKWTYKDHARRFTQIIGTRIQALAGPFPALILPRGALHAGPHYTKGRLELDNFESHQGACYIYTGQPLTNQ